MMSPANESHDVTNGHLAFLHRVLEDDRFRAALEADPQAALARIGLSVDSGQIPSTVTLPDAESILDVLIDVESDDDPDSGTGKPMWQGFFGS